MTALGMHPRKPASGREYAFKGLESLRSGTQRPMVSKPTNTSRSLPQPSTSGMADYAKHPIMESSGRASGREAGG